MKKRTLKLLVKSVVKTGWDTNTRSRPEEETPQKWSFRLKAGNTQLDEREGETEREREGDNTEVYERWRSLRYY